MCLKFIFIPSAEQTVGYFSCTFLSDGGFWLRQCVFQWEDSHQWHFNIHVCNLCKYVSHRFYPICFLWRNKMNDKCINLLLFLHNTVCNSRWTTFSPGKASEKSFLWLSPKQRTPPTQPYNWLRLQKFFLLLQNMTNMLLKSQICHIINMTLYFHPPTVLDKVLKKTGIFWCFPLLLYI